MSDRGPSRAPLPRWTAAAAAAGLALGLAALPGFVRMSAGPGHWPGVTSGLRPSPSGRTLVGGERAWVRLPHEVGGPASVTLLLSRRRATNPVRLTLTRIGAPPVVAESRMEPTSATVFFPPGSRSLDVRIDAEPLTRAFPALYVIHEIGVDRREGLERRLAQLSPAVVAAGILILVGRRLPIALTVIWSLYGAAGSVATLLAFWDTAARFQLRPWAWEALWHGLAATFLPLLVVSRLSTRRLRESGVTEGGWRTRNALVGGASVLVSLGFVLLGLLLGITSFLRLVFPDINPEEAGVVARTGSARAYLFGAAYITFFAGLLVATSRRVRSLPNGVVGAYVFAIQVFFYLTSLEAVAATRYAPIYFPEDPNVQARASRAVYLKDDFFGHLLNPEAKDYAINSRGFRGGEFPSAKPAEELRIVAVGDSITFGTSVGEEDTYPRQLERLLLDHGKSRLYRVINAGVPAYDSQLALRTLERRVLGLSPDVVVVTVGWNDLSLSVDDDWRPGKAIALWGRPRFTPALVHMFQERWPSRPPKDGRPHPRALAAYRGNLEGMIRAATRGGCRVLLTNLPTILSADGNTPEELSKARGKFNVTVEQVQAFQTVIDEVCAAHPEVTCVDDLFPLRQAGKGRLFFDHCHLVPEGYSIMARRLCAALGVCPGGP